MGWIKEIRGALDDQHRGALIYSGKLPVFKQVPAMQRLCAFADELITAAFNPHAPENAQFELERDQFLSLAATTQDRFKKHRQLKRLFALALPEIGVDIEHSYWDRLLLRILPHGDTHAGGPTSRAGIHIEILGALISISGPLVGTNLCIDPPNERLCSIRITGHNLLRIPAPAGATMGMWPTAVIPTPA